MTDSRFKKAQSHERDGQTEAEQGFGSRVAAVKREHILDAATEAFAYRGYSHATIKDVGDKAGVSAGTIYNHFKNKEELLMAILDRVNETEERPAALGNATEQDFRAFLKGYVEHRVETVFRNAKAFQAVLPELLTNARLRARYYESVIEPTTRLARRFFAEEARRGRMRDLDPKQMTRVLAGTVLGVLMQYLLGDVDIEVERGEIAAAIANTICDGLIPAGSNE